MLVNPGRRLRSFICCSDEHRSLLISCGAHSHCIHPTSTTLPMTHQMCDVQVLQGGSMCQHWLVAGVPLGLIQRASCSLPGQVVSLRSRRPTIKNVASSSLHSSRIKPSHSYFYRCYSQKHSSLRNALTFVLPRQSFTR